MRLLLKKNDLYLKFAWVKRLKNGSIIGWNFHDKEFLKNVPSQAKSFEIHYHYPMEGRFHFSYKYNIGNVKYEVRAYQDHLNTKVWGNIDEVRLAEILLPDFKKFQEFFLLANSDEVDLKKPDMFKQIGGLGFNLWTDRVANDVALHGSKMKPKVTDVVLDIDQCGKVGVSCTVLIYNDSQNISFKFLEGKEYFRVSNHERLLLIELIVQIETVA